MIHLLPALAATITIEFALLWIVLRKDPGEMLAYSTLINSLTLPLAAYAYQNLLENLLIIEILVFITEGILISLLFRFEYRKAFALSFTANAVTTLSGILLFSQFYL